MAGKKHPFYGLHRSLATRKKISEGNKGTNNGKYRHDINTQKIVEMYEKGLTLKEIGKIMNCSYQTIGRRLNIYK